jgi:hypothetical protein
MKENKKITMSKEFFEHLLGCLANQKFINDVNADGMSLGVKKINKIKTKHQKAIDQAYQKGCELLFNCK